MMSPIHSATASTARQVWAGTSSLCWARDATSATHIIVSNRRDKASQTFFRRDGSKGDVVSFIRENLSSFNVIGLTEWQKIAKVMAQFANMPEPDYDRDRDYVRSASAPQVFDPSRYRVKELDAANIPRLFAQRGLSADTSRLSPRSFPCV